MIAWIRKLIGLDSRNEENIFIFTIIGLAIILGAIVRTQYISNSDYPINDGGFFFQMVEDLIDNGFRLPKYTTYNQANIPFAYPPLAFYLTGWLHYYFGIPKLTLFQYLPVIVSVFTIPAFYYLTNGFLEDKFYRALATFFFAMIPRSFEWFVMGGGITRSFGYIFAILAIYFYMKVFASNYKKAYILLASVFSSLTILSHPVSSLFLAFSIILLFIYSKPTKINIQKNLIMAIVVILLTSPWWITIITNHGVSPFIGAGSSGHANWFEIKNIITQNYGYENSYFLTIVSVLALLGAFSGSNKNSIKLTVLLILGYIVIPRGGVDFLTVYLALLATIGFGDILQIWNTKQNYEYHNVIQQIKENSKTRIFLFFIIAYVFLAAYTYKYVDNKDQVRLTAYDFMAMEWIRENTEEDSALLLYPSWDEKMYWWNDYRAEWLPAITKRESVTTVQGYEWLPDSFTERIFMYTDLRFCKQRGSECIKQWTEKFDIDVNFIVVGDRNEKLKLVESFQVSDAYDEVYRNEEIIVFKNLIEE